MFNKELTDIGILVLSLIATFFYSFSLYNHPRFAQKRGFIFFLVFLAMLPLMNMIGHLLAISFVAASKTQSEAFQYDFRFYSLLLYGVVFMLINGYSLNRLVLLSRGNWQVYGALVSANLLQFVLIVPSVVLNPLASLPALASLLIIGRLYMARRHRRSLQPTILSQSKGLQTT